MNSSPLVSIVIPVYNGAKYLAEAIDSAINQTYRNIEILVINDGSTDGGDTRKIALTYGNKIRYIEKENGGVATALNLGISEMHGEYFSWLSHDDVYCNNKIEIQINFLDGLSDKTKILYSDYCFIDENSKLIENYRVPHIPPENFRIHFIGGGIISGCTLLIPFVCFQKYGVFNKDLKITQDYDLWFRFSEQYQFVHIPEITIKSRRHQLQDTIKLRSLVITEANTLLLRFIKSIKISEIRSGYNKPVPFYYFDYARKMLEQGYKKPMWFAFYKGIINITILPHKHFREYAATVLNLLKAIKNL